ncbi:MAG: RdgB/HAM1 family non-canonical purine NTP pyrophosphatase [Rhodobacteraceae bacterium]|nr:RdgB/HAM1 family non-canonical purine NTP pyrophosphatase [Paracoccaceae bacterium]
MRRISGPEIVIATRNAGKLNEYRELLGEHDLTVISSFELGIPAPAECETTISGNARLKALHAMRRCEFCVLAEDSGLEVDALGGAPGVHSADWAEGPDGRDYAAAMLRIRDSLHGVPEPHRARFCAAICVAWPDGHTVQFSGEVRGAIVWPPRGTGGFGYDPVFCPDGSRRTFGEMTSREKNQTSHRSIALGKFMQRCVL